MHVAPSHLPTTAPAAQAQPGSAPIAVPGAGTLGAGGLADDILGALTGAGAGAGEPGADNTGSFADVLAAGQAQTPGQTAGKPTLPATPGKPASNNGLKWLAALGAKTGQGAVTDAQTAAGQTVAAAPVSATPPASGKTADADASAGDTGTPAPAPAAADPQGAQLALLASLATQAQAPAPQSSASASDTAPAPAFAAAAAPAQPFTLAALSTDAKTATPVQDGGKAAPVKIPTAGSSVSQAPAAAATPPAAAPAAPAAQTQPAPAQVQSASDQDSADEAPADAALLTSADPAALPKTVAAPSRPAASPASAQTAARPAAAAASAAPSPTAQAPAQPESQAQTQAPVQPQAQVAEASPPQAAPPMTVAEVGAAAQTSGPAPAPLSGTGKGAAKTAATTPNAATAAAPSGAAAPARSAAAAPQPASGDAQQAPATDAGAQPAATADAGQPAPQDAQAFATLPETAPAPVQAQIQAADNARAGPETVQRLATQIVQTAQGPASQFNLTLHPAELGGVQVKIQVDRNGAVRAALTFDNPQAAADLGARADDLRAALGQAGFDVADNGLSFSMSGQGNPGAGERDADTGAWGGRAFRAAAAGADDLLTAVNEAASRLSSASSAGGLDIRI